MAQPLSVCCVEQIGHKGVVDFSRHEVAESPAPKTPSASKFLPPRPASPPHHPLEWAMTSDEASTADKAAVAELVASSEFSSISELWAGYQAVKRDVQRLRLREKRFESDPLLLRTCCPCEWRKFCPDGVVFLRAPTR